VTSIYRRALGPEFDRLHPEIAARFDLSSTGGIASIGTGVMEEIWRRPGYTRPFLSIGSFRHIMFPEHGTNVPFQIENWPYVDRFGRETVTFNRTFELDRQRRRFDATMIYSEERGTVVDYLGTHQHLAADVWLSVDSDGGINLRTGEQRFYERWVGFDFPMMFSGKGNVHEWFEEKTGRHQIEVNISNDRFGKLFAYRGSFTVETITIPSSGVPSSVKPLREERRE
jgi:Domain of unknown function (DUF4166)